MESSTLRADPAQVAKRASFSTLAPLEFRLPQFWACAAIFLFYFIVYSPVLFLSYGYSDDYPILASALQHRITNMVQLTLWEGRLLYALYIKLAYSAARGVGDLSYLRAFGVAGIGAASALFHRELSKTSLPRIVCLAAALLFGLTPPFQVYAAWAECAVFPWAAVLAAAAFVACDSGGASPAGWLRLGGAVLLLSAALAVYQPVAMVFWTFAAIAWLVRPDLPSARSVLAAGAVMLVSLAFGYGMVRFGLYAIYGIENANPRAGLVKDYLDKIVWFIREPLVNASDVFSIRPSAVTSLFVVFFITPGFFLFYRSDLRQTLARLAIAAVLLPASYLPNLLVEDQWASYRTEIALTGSILIYLVIASMGWARVLRVRRFIPAACVLTVAAASLAATRNATTEIAVPQVVEYSLIESALLKMDFHEGDKICLKLPRWQESLAPITFYEFGSVSSSEWWNPLAMLWLMMRDHNSPHADMFLEKPDTDAEETKPGDDVGDPPYLIMTPGCKEIDLDAILSRSPKPGGP